MEQGMFPSSCFYMQSIHWRFLHRRLWPSSPILGMPNIVGKKIKIVKKGKIKHNIEEEPELVGADEDRRTDRLLRSFALFSREIKPRDLFARENEDELKRETAKIMKEKDANPSFYRACTKHGSGCPLEGSHLVHRGTCGTDAQRLWPMILLRKSLVRLVYVICADYRRS